MRFTAPEDLPFAISPGDFQSLLNSLLEELRRMRPESTPDHKIPMSLQTDEVHEPGSLADQWLQTHDMRHLPKLLEHGLRADLSTQLKAHQTSH